jgi:hypothetical protein
VADLKGIPAKDDKTGELEGKWRLVAKVPSHSKEPNRVKEPIHVTEPIDVQIQKRALRVLLFAGGATREYQFVRTILYREMVEKRMEMAIYLQTGKEDHIDQDVDAKRMLSDFPDRIGPAPLGQEFTSLSDYDVVIAFDPDWSKLTPKQLLNLREWVANHAGGVVFVAGPVFSFQLARPKAYGLEKTLLSIYPVIPKDSRLHGIGLTDLGHDATRPYALTFSPQARLHEFIKLDETGESPIAGWNGFFFNNEKTFVEPGKEYRPKRGFYNYYPVDRLQPASEVIAAFAGPKESRIGEKSSDFRDQQPFLVGMKVGSGKSLYIGSGELWRLRAYKDGFHERLWIKMARNVATGALERKKYGQILMPRTVSVGAINFEAQVKGKDLLALSRDIIPFVRVKRIDKDKDEKAPELRFDLQPKQSDGDWQGYFTGTTQIREPGEYEFQLPIPDTNESLRQSIVVKKPNPELDNVRTNFGYLYQLASEVSSLKNVPAETRKEIEKYVQVPEANAGTGERASKRLFFPVSSADMVAKCLVPIPPKTETVQGRYEDLWDKGLETGMPINAIVASIGIPLVVGVIGALILLILRQWISALIFFGICFGMSLAIAVFNLVYSNYMNHDLDINFSFLMVVIVSLLGIEWLARKLLRLA